MIKMEEFQSGRDLVRARLCRFTRKAFQLLPRLDRPRILDVGCGSGVATIELAKLCDCQIVALDINEHDLNRLDAKIEKEGLSHRVSTLKCSMLDMKFPNDSFDIIWAEGSIYIIGFERGLREWARFLRTNGFFVVHDET
jgi:ubiquinone/menaquinone biosynthesis C-methylase UbiE